MPQSKLNLLYVTPLYGRFDSIGKFKFEDPPVLNIRTVQFQVPRCMTMEKAMLGNMTRESGKVSYSGKLAFIPQEAWIQNGSVRDNVIFSLPYDKEKYKKVLSMTGLDSDIKQLKNGSKTLIGEKGIRQRFQK